MWGGVGTQKEPGMSCRGLALASEQIDTDTQLDLCRHYLLEQRHVKPVGPLDTWRQACKSGSPVLPNHPQ